MRTRFPVHLARVRLPMLYAGILIIAVNLLWDIGPLVWAGIALLAVSYALMLLPGGRVRRDPIKVRPPITGRWVAVNSPADRVPSHGLHAYGQTYAIDLVHHPDENSTWKGVRAWPLARPPRAFPAFGRPVLAPADGVVARASGWRRDHWSRNSPLALIYLFAEGTVRELFGPGFVLGNHIVLDLGDGVYAALAHLRRGSVRVRKGQRVRAGEPLAQCGNSGNSSEPHLHFQLMDHPRVVVAAGLPFAFDQYETGAGVRQGVPCGRSPFTVFA